MMEANPDEPAVSIFTARKYTYQLRIKTHANPDRGPSRDCVLTSLLPRFGPALGRVCQGRRGCLALPGVVLSLALCCFVLVESRF